MAVYSLICWGGLNGKTATMTIANPCVVTINSHGRKNGMPVKFTTTGSLPTGVTSGTTYYAGNVAANTFNLYDTAVNALAGGSTGRVATSGTQSGTHTAKSPLVSGDLSRYGSTRVYDGIVSYFTAIATADPSSHQIAEIGEAFIEYNYQNGLVSTAAAVTVTSTIDGTRTSAYHGRIFGNGFYVESTGYTFSISTFNCTFDGIEINCTNSGATIIQANYYNGFVLRNSLIRGVGKATSTQTAVLIGAKSWIDRCIIKGVGTGVLHGQYYEATITNNLVAECVTGYNSSGANKYGRYFNNIAIGCTNNWSTQSSALNAAANNLGQSGDTNPPYSVAGGVTGTIATTDFVNYAGAGAAATDFYPAAITSPQVETGVAYLDIPSTDIAGNVVPSWSGANYNTAVTAGSFVAGLSYTVATVGTTDFTAIGAYNASVTFTDTGDTVGLTGNQFQNGDAVYFSAITSTTGISTNTIYYVVNRAAATFQVSATYGGTALALTTNGTGTVVRCLFKATGVGTGTGTAILNAKVDAGPFEYDLGYGAWPQTQSVTVSGYATGSRISINKQSDGTEIYNSDSPSFPQTTSYTSDTAVYVYIRKGSSATYYHPVRLAGTIDPVAGLTLDATGLQVEDIAAATYDAQIDTDWGINWSTGAITHDSGTTRWSVQGIYSMHQNESDSATNIDALPLMHGTTPTQFELINSGSISAGDLEDLYGGSIELTNGDIYTNVYTVGTLAASHDLYIYQGSTKLTQFWAAGHLDILTKTYDGSTGAISGGVLTVFARPWGYTYDYWVTGDTSAGGRHVAALSTAVDSAITETTGTVAGWTDVTHTFGDTNKNFGDVHGSQPYKVVINCNNRPLSEVYQRNQYLTRAGAATLNGIPGDRYLSADAAYTPVKSAPFGTYSGGVFVGAKGVWLDNVPSGDLLNYILTDSNGNTHQNTAALNQSVTISGLVVGSRVQIYDTTNATELYNAIAATSSVSWEDPSAPVGDRAIRVRIAYVSGVTAKEFIEANIGTCGTSSTTKDVTYLASQVNDAVYNSNAVNGSLVTGVTFVDTTTDRMEIALAGGEISLKNMYAAWVYYAFTATGIATDIDYIEAIDAANYVYTNLVWKNTSSPSVPLKVIDGYAWDSVTGDPIDLIDTSGGTIFLAPPHVVVKTISTSASVVEGTPATVAAAVLSAAQSTPIYADMRKTVGTALQGDGTELDKFRSVLVP